MELGPGMHRARADLAGVKGRDAILVIGHETVEIVVHVEEAGVGIGRRDAGPLQFGQQILLPRFPRQVMIDEMSHFVHLDTGDPGQQGHGLGFTVGLPAIVELASRLGGQVAVAAGIDKNLRAQAWRPDFDSVTTSLSRFASSHTAATARVWSKTLTPDSRHSCSKSSLSFSTSQATEPLYLRVGVILSTRVRISRIKPFLLPESMIQLSRPAVQMPPRQPLTSKRPF